MNYFSILYGHRFKLRELARAESVEVEEDIYLADSQRYQNEDLRHFEAEFDHYPAKQQPSEGNIVLIEAANRRAEIHAVARTIRKLMIAGKRYKDISILYRQPEKYDELIETIFPHYDIPVFISQKETDVASSAYRVFTFCFRSGDNGLVV